VRVGTGRAGGVGRVTTRADGIGGRRARDGGVTVGGADGTGAEATGGAGGGTAPGGAGAAGAEKARGGVTVGGSDGGKAECRKAGAGAVESAAGGRARGDATVGDGGGETGQFREVVGGNPGIGPSTGMAGNCPVRRPSAWAASRRARRVNGRLGSTSGTQLTLAHRSE
jgi:hypothetical protein